MKREFWMLFQKDCFFSEAHLWTHIWIQDKKSWHSISWKISCGLVKSENLVRVPNVAGILLGTGWIFFSNFQNDPAK